MTLSLRSPDFNWKFIFAIFAALFIFLTVCKCSSVEKPDTDTLVREAKEDVKAAKALRENLDTAEPSLVAATLDRLVDKVEKLTKAIERLNRYIATLEQKIKDLKESFAYTVGSYVEWILIVLGLLLGLYLAFKAYATFAPPGSITHLLNSWLGK